MAALELNDPEVVLAWAIFRAEEPENLGTPDPRSWSNVYLPMAREVLAEYAAHGYQISKEVTFA
jgi:hypothetical protein